MATVTEVAIIDRKGTATTGKRTAVDTYQVTFDPAGTVPTINDFRNASAGGVTMPKRGDYYDPTDIALRCKTIDGGLKSAPTWKVWVGDVTYETGDVGDEQENPLDEPFQVSIGSQSTDEPVYKDRFGNAITNSANETFDPPVTKDIYDAVFTITGNVAQYDEVTGQAYRGMVNSQAFNIRGASSPIAAFKAKILEYSGSYAVKNGIPYWALTIVIATRKDGWKRNILDQGFSERDPLTGKPKVFKDDEGYPLNQPRLLDGLGKPLASGAPAVFLVKELEEQISFAGLNLPT